MAESRFTDDDDALLAELGVEVETESASIRSPREERIIAGFGDIERFFEEHGRLPGNADNYDIFERIYAVRLDRIRASDECRQILASLDPHGLLEGRSAASKTSDGDLSDEALLAELGVLEAPENDITKLTHVKTRAESRTAEEVAKRTPCADFEKFKPLFRAVQDDLKSGKRQGRRFKVDASIEQGEFFILGGQITYVAEVGALIKTTNGATDARLRVIYDNGTESDLLMRSLQRALYKDDAGRRITDPSLGPLFSDEEEDGCKARAE
jgi:hypothetical protein